MPTSASSRLVTRAVAAALRMRRGGRSAARRSHGRAGCAIPPPRGGTRGGAATQPCCVFTGSSPDRHDPVTQSPRAAGTVQVGRRGAGEWSRIWRVLVRRRKLLLGAALGAVAGDGGGRRRGGREPERLARPSREVARAGEGLERQGQVRDLPARRRHGPVGDHDRPQLPVRRGRPAAGHRHAAADRRHHDLRAAGGRSVASPST